MIKAHVESVEVYDVTCERCNYQWQALGKVPVRCSRCKSPYFNQPRQKQSQKRIKRTVTFLPKEDKQ